MGFWHTGYIEFHEPKGWGSEGRPEQGPPTYPCPVCGQVFGNVDDLAVHRFDGHVTSRPILSLKGRECGRSRLSVISNTSPEDWTFQNATRIRLNGQAVTEAEAKSYLSSAALGVVSVVLSGDRTHQEFEFSFSIANEDDLSGVDEKLDELVRGRSLTINAIDAFLDRASAYTTARPYRDGLANYLYGVLAREDSKESGLLRGPSELPAYTAKFDEAVAALGGYDRPPAEAICGLVAFHYNQFPTALRKTHSPRVARAARRLAFLLSGEAPRGDDSRIDDRSSLDHVLSDAEIEKVLTWSCLPLDGSAKDGIAEIEAAIESQRPDDAFKLHVIAAEHYRATGQKEQGLRHVLALRHSIMAERWAVNYRYLVAG